jgi:hypothetical protein
MATVNGAQLSQLVREKSQEFRKLCAGLDEATASRAPVGRWSPKQIVSHLCGPEGIGMLPMLHAIVEQETPRIDLDPENPFYSEKRAKMTLAELIAEYDGEYNRIAQFVAGLSEQQLTRKAHMPLLKETPIGDYPTLATLTQDFIGYHLTFHIDHMREILEALKTPGP